MAKHHYFGEIEQDWAGFSAERKLRIPYFETDVTVFLGEQFDEEGEEVSIPPTDGQLSGFVRILGDDTIRIRIRYALDEEHGLELKIVNNKVAAVGGIAET